MLSEEWSLLLERVLLESRSTSGTLCGKLIMDSPFFFLHPSADMLRSNFEDVAKGEFLVAWRTPNLPKRNG